MLDRRPRRSLTSPARSSPQLKTDSSSDAAAAGDPDAPPSKRLFMPSLPLECTVDMLEVLFSPYAGYVRATMPRSGLGFCEFLDETASTKAKEALQGFKLTPEIGLEVFFGK